jgi:hypothetical protein
MVSRWTELPRPIILEVNLKSGSDWNSTGRDKIMEEIMFDSVLTSLLPLAALVVGGSIGFSFGELQSLALSRNRERQVAGRLRTGVGLIPVSFGRVAVLLFTLAVVQIVCPILFDGNVRWMVSAGLILGYGWTMLRQLRQRPIDRA